MKFDDVRVGDVFFDNEYRRTLIITWKGPFNVYFVYGGGQTGALYEADWESFYLGTTYLTHYDRIILKGESDDR